jgi:glycosyltransferase involved in cell wall biosynthesis
MTDKEKSTVVILSTFPPRECGLATFAMHLSSTLPSVFSGGCDIAVAAMNRGPARQDYPATVEWQISQDAPEDYLRVAAAINERPDVRLVHIQHEFGIFGGELGANLLLLTEALKKPFVVTYHTVLPEPLPAMRRVVGELSAQASRVVVMTAASRRLLTEAYGVASDKVAVVPHDIIPMPFEDQTTAKAELGFSGRSLLLTFGLLSPNKGIEYVIEAMPEVVRHHPDALYLIVGATHPEIVAREGEWYREKLLARVKELGLSSHVSFHDEFVSDERLQVFLHAADVYVATSLDPNQASSGTLSYAMGSGRPVISTAFAQAREIVSPETGLLVGFRDPAAYAQAIMALLGNHERRTRMGLAAFGTTRHMTWPNVALQTMRLYAECNPVFDRVSLRLPPVSLEHVRRLVDDFGMLQFSDVNVPDPDSGYTVDDNARALVDLVRHYQRFGESSALEMSQVCLSFLERTGHPASFCAQYGPDRRPAAPPSPSDNHEDAQGRLVMALAVTADSPLPSALSMRCRALLDEWLASSPNFKSPRAAAFLVIGLAALLRAGDADPRLAALITSHCDHLASLYESQRADGWEWFEPCISYSNGTICEALLAGGQLLGNARWLEIGRRTADFLISQTFIDGRYVAIGQSRWCRRGEPRALYDQQPEDVAAMVSALAVLAAAWPDGPYTKMARTAFDWFLGRNTLGQFVYNRATGGCYDGLGERAVNLNQGAESTLAYLQARLTVDSL